MGGESNCGWKWEKCTEGLDLSTCTERQSQPQCEIPNVTKPIQWLAYQTWSSSTRIHKWFAGKQSSWSCTFGPNGMQQNAGCKYNKVENDYLSNPKLRKLEIILLRRCSEHRLV